MTDVLIVLPKVTMDPHMCTRLYLELSPGMRCIGRSAEAVLAEREDVEAYRAWTRLHGSPCEALAGNVSTPEASQVPQAPCSLAPARGPFRIRWPKEDA